MIGWSRSSECVPRCARSTTSTSPAGTIPPSPNTSKRSPRRSARSMRGSPESRMRCAPAATASPSRSPPDVPRSTTRGSGRRSNQLCQLQIEMSEVAARIGAVRFLDLAATSAAVTATSGRKAKIELLADALRRLDPGEIAAGSAFLAGELRQRQTGVGYAGLRDRPAPAEEATLTVAGVDAAIAEISVVSGAGSQARRRELVRALFGAATADEQRLLIGLFGGELRQGAQAGLLADAIAKAAEVPLTAVRRALLLSGDLKQVAVAALTGGAAALAEIHLRVGTPLTPMLAQSAPDVGAALLATGTPAAVDVKLDGIRIQVHRSGDEVAVFTRSLDDITPRMPEVVAAVRKLAVREVVLDGEAMALDAQGRPRPFQETSSRAATRGARRGGTSAEPTAGPALVPYFFDLLHLDGTDLLDQPGRVRW